MRGEQGSSTQISSSDLKGLFTVDVSTNVADCGAITLSLTSDEKGTSFVTSHGFNYLSLLSNSSLSIPTAVAMPEVSFYVKAVTPGNKIAYQKMSVEITPCGTEVLTSNYPSYWNITAPYQSGLTRTPVLDRNFLATLFTSTVSYTECPIKWF